MSTRKRIFRTGVATLLQKALRVADQLLVVPFYLAAWGATYYGEWLTLTVVPAALALSDFGFGTAAATAFVLSYSSGQREKAASVLRTGFRMLVIVSLVVLVLVCVFLALLTQLDVFKHIDIPSREVWTTVFVLMLSRACGFFFLLFEALFRAGKRPDLGINFTTVYSLIKILAVIAVLAAGGRATHVALADLATTLVFVAFFTVKGHRLLPDVRWWRAQYLTRAETGRLASKGLGHLGYPAWQAIYFQGTTAAVRIVVGAEGVALFNTLRTLTRTVNHLPGMLEASFFPEMQLAIGEQRTATAQRLYRAGFAGSLLCAALGVLLLAAVGPVMYRLWTHGQFAPSAELWVPMLLAVFLNGSWSTASTVFRATNMPERFAVVGVVTATLSVATSWYLGWLWGLVGAAWGTLILEVGMAAYVLPASARLVDLELKKLPFQLRQDLRRRFG